jgi:IclR family pca regulon transcriptional regulator
MEAPIMVRAMAQVDGRPVGTLARGLHLLACVAAANRELGVTELALAAGLDKATTYRLASSLTRLGYLEQEPETRRFRLGLRILDLGFSYLASLDIRHYALPAMQELQQEFDGTISLTVLDGTDIVYVERLPSKRLQASVAVGIGARLPVHCTAMGKALLASLPHEQARRLLGKLQLTQWTPRTITTRGQLEAELERSRRRGYALSDQETVVGLRSVAAAVLDRTGAPLAALSVAVGVQDVSLAEIEARIAPRVVRAALAISTRLGHRANAR